MDNKKKGLESDKIKEELEKTKKSDEEYKNKYLRALADYQNFEKRVFEQKEEFEKMGEKKLILKLLPIIDGLEKAEIFIKDQGLKQIKAGFYQILKSEQVKELEVLGKEFNPETSEAIETVAGEKENIVVEVVRKGYRMGEKILRVAQVKVSKKNPKS